MQLSVFKAILSGLTLSRLAVLALLAVWRAPEDTHVHAHVETRRANTDIREWYSVAWGFLV